MNPNRTNASQTPSDIRLVDREAFWRTIYRYCHNQMAGRNAGGIEGMTFAQLSLLLHPTNPSWRDPDAQNIRTQGKSATADERWWERYRKGNGLTTDTAMRDFSVVRLQELGVDPATIPIYDNVPFGGYVCIYITICIADFLPCVRFVGPRLALRFFS